MRRRDREKKLPTTPPFPNNAPNVSAHFRSDDEVDPVDGVSYDTVRNSISLPSLLEQ